MTPSCTITQGSTTLSGRWQPWRPACRTSSSGAVNVDSNSNPSKTELIWLDRAHSIGKLQQQPLIRLNSQELSSSPSVRDLGVIIDSGLTLTTHVSILARTCFYQLRRIRQAKKNLDEDSVKTLVHALVLSRLDYCNSVLANLPEVTLAPLIRVQHSAARLIRNLRRQDSVSVYLASTIMMELHWLPLTSGRSSNNIQTLYIDARHPPWSLPDKQYMKEMVVPVSTTIATLFGPRAPSICWFALASHPSQN